MRRGPRSTPPGQHLPVMLSEVLAALSPREGGTFVDCTVGLAGHSRELLRRVGPTGRLIAFDFDRENLDRASERLAEVGHPFTVHHGNFAGVANLVTEPVDGVLADLGMSSMQVDDAGRGFSYVRDGPLDMRMDRTRGQPASELLASIEVRELAKALREFGDEEQADRLAPAIVEAAKAGAIPTTTRLAELVQKTLGQNKAWKLRSGPRKWTTHPAARTFQALRILVNRELANLTQLLRVLPQVLKPGGTAAIISFHSGEDRLVKAAFRDGLRQGVFEAAADEPLRASLEERFANPRSRSAKLRWARRASPEAIASAEPTAE